MIGLQKFRCSFEDDSIYTFVLRVSVSLATPRDRRKPSPHVETIIILAVKSKGEGWAMA
jgi:hypothetical protein